MLKNTFVQRRIRLTMRFPEYITVVKRRISVLALLSYEIYLLTDLQGKRCCCSVLQLSLLAETCNLRRTKFSNDTIFIKEFHKFFLLLMLTKPDISNSKIMFTIQHSLQLSLVSSCWIT